MRVPLSWLREWVEVPWDAGELAERLTAVGLAVESVERPGDEVRGVMVATVTAVEPHPDADQLRICSIDAGDRTARVVTGARNARPGARVVWAAPGARLAGGVEIGVRRLRGVESQGMLCSTWELGLPSPARTEEERLAEGLLLLPADLEAAPGADARPLLGLDDVVLVLELTPNYAAHCQSILGVAREVAALTGRPLTPPPLPAAARDPRPACDLIEVEIEAPDGCSRYVARLIDGVAVGPSPLWLQRRLQLCGQRPVNNLVDVTNYVMLETGQPLHGFDYARLEGRRIIVRRARAGEALRTLDGQDRALTPEDLVIADEGGPVAVAGVMGGAGSEVTPATRTVLLEAAHFDAASVLRTARRLGLRTEASSRFDKGLDPEAAPGAADRAAAMIAALGGGRVLSGGIDAVADPHRPRVIPFRPERINGLLSLDLSPGEVRGLLERYGFSVTEGGVRVPSHRTDVHGEADLAEEVARLYGYDRIPSALPPGAPAEAGRPERERVLAGVRAVMVGAGFHEVVTFSFAPADLGRRLRLGPEHPQHRALRLANPMGEELATLRTTLLGGVLEVLRHNTRRWVDNAALFELGTVYLPAEGDGPPQSLPDERQHLIAVGTGELRAGHWQGRGEVMDVYYLKGALDRVARRLGIDLTVQAAVLPFLHPGRGADVLLDGRAVGYLGELHPDVAEDWDLPGRVSLFEIDLT
ncbi:MAG TPA: phenylalanine--tRNA ligase subunit beta, partial [Bacillota bacterium]